MATTKSTASKSKVQPKYVRGFAYALLTPIIGVAAWIAVWRTGFIAAIVAFGMAWLAVKLYAKGAGSIDRRGAVIILLVVIAGIALSIIGMMMSDYLDYLIQEIPAVRDMGAITTLMDGRFYESFAIDVLGNPAMWQSYFWDIVWSVVLAALGVFQTLRQAFTEGRA